MQGISLIDDITHNTCSSTSRFALCDASIYKLQYHKHFHSFINQYVVAETETIEHARFPLPRVCMSEFLYKRKNAHLCSLHNSINQLLLPAKDGGCYLKSYNSACITRCIQAKGPPRDMKGYRN